MTQTFRYLFTVLVVLVVWSSTTYAEKVGYPAPATHTQSTSQSCSNPFTLISQRSISDSVNRLESLAPLSANDIWAVGSRTADSGVVNDQPLVQRWNGTFWNTVSFPDVGESARLYDVAAVSPTNVWAVGSVTNDGKSQTLIAHWNGTTWQRVAAPNGRPESTMNALYAVAAINAQNVWAVGDDGGEPLLLHWNGLSWTRMPAVTSGGNIVWLRDVFALTDNNMWAVGIMPAGGSGAVIMHYDGSTWSMANDATTSVDGQLVAVSATSSTNVWAVGTQSYKPLFLHFDGSQWQKVKGPDLPFPDNYELSDVVAVTPNNAWAVGRSSYQALVLHWDGATWRNVSPPQNDAGSEQYASVAVIGNDVWTVGKFVKGSARFTTLTRRYRPTLSFGSSTITRTTTDGTAKISIRTASSNTNPITVAYKVRDGSARAGVDYNPVSGTLTIPACEQEAFINIPLLPDATWKPSATIEVALEQPVGAAIDGSGSVLINIADSSKAPTGQVVFFPSLQKRASEPAGRIAYVGLQNNNWDIYVMQPDGSDRRRLTFSPALDTAPAWSPDGERIAFVSARDGNQELYIMNADGAGIKRLTGNPGPDTQPTWSPDNKHIAFVSRRKPLDDQQLIYVLNVDTGAVTRPGGSTLKIDPHDDHPAWSPDGQFIAFTSMREGKPGMWLMRSDGSNPKQLTTDYFDKQPAWSPDNSRIAYATGLPQVAQINLISPTGGASVELNGNFDTGLAPSWSPDGRYIAAADYYGNGIAITEVGKGTPPVRLPRLLEQEANPVWSRR